MKKTTTTTTTTTAAAAAALAVADNAAAAIIAAKKAEEENAAKASAAAGQSPDVPDTLAPGQDADAPSFPGFVARPDTTEKRKVSWRENAPAVFALLAALPSDIASVKTQTPDGKFEPTARRARIDVKKLGAFAREQQQGNMREGLFYVLQTVNRVGEQNDLRRSDIRSATITLFAGSTSTSASRKGYSPYES